MHAFIVEVQNRPGELAQVTEAIASKGINLTSTSTIAYGTKGAIGLLTNDESGTRSALEDAGITYREVESVSFDLPDRPGSLADASRKLANAGVNIEFLVPTAFIGGNVTVAAAVDNVPAAKQALGSLISVPA